jgi:hypothetical protein
MLSNRVVFGYHGCDASLAERLVTRRANLKTSTSEFDWLGSGAYFWEDSPDRARRWAEEKAINGTHGIKKPAVVGAIIDLGNCLNLVDSESLDLLKESFQILQASPEPLPQNHGEDGKARALDCAVIETLHRFRADTGKTEFDTVRSFFLEGCELYPGAGFRELDHVQICVRTMHSIKGFFLPR